MDGGVSGKRESDEAKERRSERAKEGASMMQSGETGRWTGRGASNVHALRGLAKGALLCTCAAATILTGVSGLVGCQLVGGMITVYEENAEHEVKATYRGLQGKSFAVLVSADRSIQGEHPGLVEFVHSRVVETLSDPKNLPRPNGFVPSADVLAYLARNPGWAAKPMAQLGKDLGGVDRLILIEIGDYRLMEPGNNYEWNGAAAANVSVFELDGGETKSELAVLDRTITVTFPDKKSMTPNDMGQQLVTSALAKRIVDRASWLFFDHMEPMKPKY